MCTGAQIAMSAVIGGTAEKLGGGKFANGAVTGAYVMMFNHLMHGENIVSNENNMPNVLDYKNKELVTVDGTDYILYDNKWLELLPNERYEFFIEDTSHPKGGRWISRSREEIAITGYQKEIGYTGGLSGTGIGGSVFWVELAYGIYKKSPIGIIVGFPTGAIVSLRRMEARMAAHDQYVEHLRNKRE
jgi:hypothetical protein